jgi:hypothetical protein
MKLNEQVPFETFLDVLLIEEIPVENDRDTGITNAQGQKIVRTEKAARKPVEGIVLSCDSRFPMNGVWVDMPYRPGDVVRTNEFGRDYIVFNPEDEARPDAKKFYQIRYEDVYGLVRREPRYQLSDDYLTAREVNA